MNQTVEKLDLFAGLRQLTLADVDRRLVDLDAERAALSLLRRSLAARDRARRRSHYRPGESGGTPPIR
jgi:hypothetical protein